MTWSNPDYDPEPPTYDPEPLDDDPWHRSPLRPEYPPEATDDPLTDDDPPTGS